MLPRFNLGMRPSGQGRRLTLTRGLHWVVVLALMWPNMGGLAVAGQGGSPQAPAARQSDPTATPSQTGTPDAAATGTDTPASPTPDATETETPTPAADTDTPTATGTSRPSATGTPTSTATDTASATPSATASLTATASATVTPTLRVTAAATATATLTPTAAATLGPAPTLTATVTATPTATITPTVPVSGTPSAALLALIPPGLARVDAVRNPVDGSEAAEANPAGAAMIFLGGRMAVIAPPGTFAENVRLVLWPRALLSVTQQTISTTAGIALLAVDPEDAPLQIDIEAAGVTRGQPVRAFDQPLRLVFDLRDLPGAGPARSWYIAYQDANDPTQWQRYPTTVHDAAGLISTQTDHFSGYVAAPDGAAWHYRWNPPTVATFSGAATYRYPIEVPPGRAGLTPNIDFSYSSRGLDGLVLTNQDQGPLGLGWSLNNIEISRNGTHLADDGANLRMQHADNFVLVLNGASYTLAPSGSTLAGTVRYYAQDGPQLFIQRIYDANAAGANPDRFYWLVKTPDGTTYRLGYTPDAESGQSAFIDVGGHAGYPGAGSYSGMRWRVDTVTDVSGNQIQYDYAAWNQNDYYNYNGHEMDLVSGLRRIAEIRYNFTSQAAHPHDRRPAGEARTKLVFVGTADNRVGQILFYHTNLATAYQRIDIGLADYDQGTCGQHTHTRFVTSITQRNGGGTVSLPATTFISTTLSHAWGDCYRYAYVSEVRNGYGGRTKFTYSSDNRYDDCPPTPLWDCIPSYAKSFYVTRTETWDGITPQPASVDYAYQSPCYDQMDGPLPPGGANCPTHNLIPGPLFGDFPYGFGPLVGFAQATVTQRDYDGTAVLSQSLSQFHTDLAKLGKPFLQQVLDPKNNLAVLQRIDTTYATDNSNPAPFTYLSQATEQNAGGGGPAQQRTIKYFYDTDQQGGAQYGNLVREEEYDAAGALSRCTRRQFFPNTTAWIVNRPAFENVYTACTWALGDLRSSVVYLYNGSAAPNYAATPDQWGRARAMRRWNGDTVNLGYVDTRYDYDPWGNRTHEKTYPNFGTAATYAGGSARVTQTGYDATYHLYPVQITNALTHVQTISYDVTLGLPLSVTDANGDATQYRYDAFGRLTKVIQPGDTETHPTVEHTYNDGLAPFGQVTILRETAGSQCPGCVRPIQTFYDGLGREIQVKGETADGSQNSLIERRYNALGLLQQESAPRFVNETPSNTFWSYTPSGLLADFESGPVPPAGLQPQPLQRGQVRQRTRQQVLGFGPAPVTGDGVDAQTHRATDRVAGFARLQAADKFVQVHGGESPFHFGSLLSGVKSCEDSAGRGDRRPANHLGEADRIPWPRPGESVGRGRPEHLAEADRITITRGVTSVNPRLN
ncbi:MAG: hypothetical protein IT318_12550 [Anaerolineales bacterium]|nr:hypothetical protein [Anaerolineales bacterium]